jgi:putative DNA primase/helicase
MRKAVMLMGSGCNGKSVLLNLIQALAGRKNVSHVPLQMFAEHRFSPVQLFGKIANICGDLDARAVQRSDFFKMITGGDEIQGEWKFKNPFQFKPFALLLFSANEHPHTSDQTPAWFNRWLIIPMETQIKQIDPHLTAKLTTAAELKGLLVKAVRGLQRLMARNRFEIPESAKRAGESYKDRVDTVRAFLKEYCEEDLSWRINRALLYDIYAAWVKQGHRHPRARDNFLESVRRHYGEAIRFTANKGTRYIAGIHYLGEGSDGLQSKIKNQS